MQAAIGQETIANTQDIYTQQRYLDDVMGKHHACPRWVLTLACPIKSFKGLGFWI